MVCSNSCNVQNNTFEFATAAESAARRLHLPDFETAPPACGGNSARKLSGLLLADTLPAAIGHCSGTAHGGRGGIASKFNISESNQPSAPPLL
jgi:hypothetical protein